MGLDPIKKGGGIEGGIAAGAQRRWRNVPVLKPRLFLRVPTEKPLSARGRPSFTYGRLRGVEGGEGRSPQMRWGLVVDLTR